MSAVDRSVQHWCETLVYSQKAHFDALRDFRTNRCDPAIQLCELFGQTYMLVCYIQFKAETTVYIQWSHDTVIKVRANFTIFSSQSQQIR